MADIEFDPGSLRKGSEGIGDVSRAFLEDAAAHLERVGDMSQLGRNDMLAAALQLVYGSVIMVAQDVVTSHGENLDWFGGQLADTASAYEKTEEYNISLGHLAGKASRWP